MSPGGWVEDAKEPKPAVPNRSSQDGEFPEGSHGVSVHPQAQKQTWSLGQTGGSADGSMGVRQMQVISGCANHRAPDLVLSTLQAFFHRFIDMIGSTF